ncbi:MAG: DUF4837 family protein [Bacteroidota bacterium]
MKNLISLLLLAILLSCNNNERSKKPSATGKAGELLVVTPENKWTGMAGNLIRENFASPVPMLPQVEPNFNIIQIKNEEFVKLFETHRNLLFVDFDETIEKAKIEIQRNVWSYPQMVIRVTVPDENTLERLLDKNQEQFVGLYNENERERMINAYNRMLNHQAKKWVKENLDLKISVPEGYFIAKQTPQFVWLRQTGTREDLDLGLLISVLPYKDPEKDFNHETIWARRDSLTKKHIPGTFPDSYMTTYADIPPLFREINFNGNYAVEARGLWKVQGDFMGGPFINVTFVDEQQSRIINIDGFVYAPGFEKRDYLRQVEALMYSVMIPSEEDEEDQEDEDDQTDTEQNQSEQV